MASIIKRKRKNGSYAYRVQVRKKGWPSNCMTCDDLQDAIQWGAYVEKTIKDILWLRKEGSNIMNLIKNIDLNGMDQR